MDPAPRSMPLAPRNLRLAPCESPCGRFRRDQEGHWGRVQHFRLPGGLPFVRSKGSFVASSAAQAEGTLSTGILGSTIIHASLILALTISLILTSAFSLQRGFDQCAEASNMGAFVRFLSHKRPLESMGYESLSFCHGRGRGFEPRRPRDSFQMI